MPSWTFYSKPTWRYRDEKGRFASQAQIWKYSEESIQSTTAEMREAALNLPPTEYEALMRRMIKMEVIKQYTLGIGGQSNLTPVDYGVMGGVIADQYRYLDKMMLAYQNGDISPAEVARRTAMYINSTREAYERANARVRGLPLLPDYPGSGHTPCKTNCKCHWEYHWRKNRWECYWTMSAVENCTGCIDHSNEWSPLIVEV